MNITTIKNKKLFNFIVENIDIVLFLTIIFMKLMNYAKQISPDYLYAKVSHPIFASILIIMSFSLILKEKSRVSFLYTVDIVISLVLIADLMYYRYFKDITTLAALKNAKLLGGVSSSVSNVANIKDFLYILDIVVLFPIIKKYKEIKRNYRSLSKRLISFALVFSLGIGFNTKFFYEVSKDQPTLLSSMSNRIYLTKMIGNVNFHAVDAYNYISTNIKNSKKLPPEKEAEIKNFLLDNNKETEKANLKGEGKNLIVIQVEALQEFVINKKVNGQYITPNLNRWINKSMYFDNYFYQVAGGNTSDAEFMTNNSLYPAQSGAAYYSYSGNNYESLGKALKDKGYYTTALHGNDEGFWNRNVMYKSEFFDDFFGKSSFNIDEEIGLGLSDKSFLNQSLEKMKKFEEPYYSFLVTLTSHFPYDDVKKYGNFDVGEYEGTFLGDYLKSIHYTDEQLGMFLDKLDKEGIANKSIIAIYGDHFAIPKEHIQELYKFENINKDDDFTWFQYQKVPLLIHFPEDKHAEVNHVYSGQMDLYPTLANIFNLKKEYMFGKDMLNCDTEKVVFRNGSFTDGKTLYVSWTNTYYDIKTGNKIDETEELKKEKEKYTKELEYSDQLLNQNLIKSFSRK